MDAVVRRVARLRDGNVSRNARRCFKMMNLGRRYAQNRGARNESDDCGNVDLYESKLSHGACADTRALKPSAFYTCEQNFSAFVALGGRARSEFSQLFFTHPRPTEPPHFESLQESAH
jgi:hypothetical protein